MWPFNKNKKVKPSITIDDTKVFWDGENYPAWEFEKDSIIYTYYKENFDTAILKHLPTAIKWITDLNTEIDKEISINLKEYKTYKGEKDLISVDLTDLIEENKIDIAFCGNGDFGTEEDWGDLGINIVIQNGSILESYSGD
ncbi:MAG: NYN domain-containing protein [Lentisphaeraceae bacterium]|nr:NYN domain-containing protein [Lentisphaeraceae bacterium]